MGGDSRFTKPSLKCENCFDADIAEIRHVLGRADKFANAGEAWEVLVSAQGDGKDQSAKGRLLVSVLEVCDLLDEACELLSDMNRRISDLENHDEFSPSEIQEWTS